MSKPLSFQPLTKETAAKLLLDGGFSIEKVCRFICADSPNDAASEVEVGSALARRCGCWDAADEFVRRMRR